jgi:lipoprotein-anchoring transpeptidase ErfK/SrfK
MVGISEEDEISGRALREMVASVVLLGLSAAPLTVAQAGTATGDAGPRQTTKSPHPSSSGHSLHRAKQRQSQSSTQQKPAKIYQDVLDRATPQNMHVTVSLSKQRVYLMVGDEIAIDSPISSGRAGRSTPTGSFTVTEKDKNHISTIYHCSMKYYLRLSGRSFGLHVGQLPGYPASHGCVRLPENVAQVLFERANIGTSVTIQA